MKGNFFRLFIIILFLGSCLQSQAQTARVYRGTSLIGTYTTLAAASAAASLIGDSIVLSAHTFKEHNIPMPGGRIWQGTITATDTSTIDAESKGVIGLNIPVMGRALTIRDIICKNGSNVGSSTVVADGGGFYFLDSLILKGRTIIRNCYAQRCGGGVNFAYAYDWVKITNNRSDSFGGGVGNGIIAFDSVEISYNTSRFGGGIGYVSVAGITCSSHGVRIHHNTATVGGGAIYGVSNMTAGQITDNQAPLGAALYTTGCVSQLMQNVYIKNPSPSGNRQNEIYVRSGFFNMEGAWFGKSDTIGLIQVGPAPCDPTNAVRGKYAKANWSVNWGKPITSKDTLFPIGAGFTYSDGVPLPPKSLPWLVGNFSSSTGKMLIPKPKMSATDTMSSLFRTYVYSTKVDTTSKPINFVCIVDEDTFRSSPRVWGIDSIKLGITNNTKETQVMVYPNPAQEVLNIQGVEIGSSIMLYDLMGKLVLQKVCDSTITRLDVEHLTKGTYTLKIITKEGNEGSAKVMKE
jgi:predicted outer membrane repeat protein